MKTNPGHIRLTLFTCLALLAGCSDPRDKTNGTPNALATYSVADEILEKEKLVLGASYNGLRSARSAKELDAHMGFFTSEQLEAVATIQRQLGNCITVIEKEPGTRAPALADSFVQQNRGFLTSLPRLQQRWMAVRQRMPRQ